MGRLTTHVLDTSRGCPAIAVGITLYRLETKDTTAKVLIKKDITNADGRLDSPILIDDQFRLGIYELIFQAGDYFRANRIELPTPAFIDEVVLRFGIADADSHYHVPLLVSPWSYSTYRGS